MLTETEEKIRIDLLTPLTADFMLREDEWDDDMWGQEKEYPLIGEELVEYKDAIQEMVNRENTLGGENGKPCNLMQYFDDSPAITEKVESATVSVKEVGATLYGCTSLVLRDYLEAGEMRELCDYIKGQYSDGWGEGFEQRDIAVEGGTLNVHFWQSEGIFRFQEMMVQEPTRRKEAQDKRPPRPKLKLIGHDGNIFSILADARRLLKESGQGGKVDEMIKRVENSGSYYKALDIVSEYVETELSKPARKKERQKPEKEAPCR